MKHLFKWSIVRPSSSPFFWFSCSCFLTYMFPKMWKFVYSKWIFWYEVYCSHWCNSFYKKRLWFLLSCLSFASDSVSICFCCCCWDFLFIFRRTCSCLIVRSAKFYFPSLYRVNIPKYFCSAMETDSGQNT